MREPPTRVRFIGHPLVSAPIMGLCGFAIYAWVQHPGAIVVGVGAIIGLMWTVKAQNTMNQYRRWQKAWDSMGEPKAARSPMPRLVAALIAVLVVGGFAIAESGTMQAGSGAALGGVVVVGGILAAIVAGIMALVKRAGGAKSPRARTRKATPQTEPVRVAVTRPAMPVPDLKSAYGILPAHSWDAIEATRK
ncbi:hypothetical protein PIB19_05970 [Sphingomonas sp. 7/4-4]|uniref:hypothetical protein n=1 Tax=Sphingomonas sp. 7/4-4 TaxID=3018446 RepID=UPI0022F39D31|nr:hypothetical protein [Sphingomonas sp. 7/4-4]WBY08943.1 hypothetical protein PIB19_05970 [Sphingomonas sp. 7/4-4]